MRLKSRQLATRSWDASSLLVSNVAAIEFFFNTDVYQSAVGLRCGVYVVSIVPVVNAFGSTTDRERRLTAAGRTSLSIAAAASSSLRNILRDTQ